MQHWLNKAQRLGDTIRFRLATVAILLCGAILMVAASGFAIAGGYMWLSTQLPDYLAALSVAGVLCLLGATVIALAAGRGGSEKAPPSMVAPNKDSEADMAAEHIARAALKITMDTPIKALAAATVVGFIVGLLRPSK